MTVLIILVLAALAALMIRIVKSRKTTAIKLLLSALCIILMLLCAVLLYFSVYYRAGESAREGISQGSPSRRSFSSCSSFCLTVSLK